MSFLQLTPENIAQARKLSYPEAFKLDRTLGYNPNFKGGVGPVKYGLEGFKSIFGFGDQKIGGATPLTRKIALDAADLFKSGVGFAAKRALPFISLFTPTEMGAAEITPEMRDSISLNPRNERQPSSFRSLSDPEVYGDVEEEKNLLEKALDFIPFVGDKSLSGILLNALGGAKDKLTGFRDAIGRRLGPAPFGTSQAAYNALTPSQQQMVESVYGQGGIMQGYNPVSAFGRGPRGAIENRIANILGRKAPQTAASRAKVKQLQKALTDIGGGGDDGGSDPTSPGGPQSMGSAQGGAGGRPY